MEGTPDKKLYDAAAEGNAEVFQQLLQQHPFLLDKVSFTHKTPLHIAAAKGYVKIASILLAESPNMCWSRDCRGMNPIHVAVMNGHVEVLKKLVEKEPFAAMEKLDRGETALHLCVKHRQLGALKVLVEKLGEFVRAEDGDGETVLHLAVRFRQVEMIQYLMGSTKMDKKSKNCKGQEPLEILKESISYSGPDETAKTIEKLLKHRSPTAISYQTPHAEWLAKKRDSIMVVAILIATMAFQAAINPPGGVWQDDTKSHKAGYAVIAYRKGAEGQEDNTFKTFMSYDTVAFVTSLTTILLLISGLAFKHKFLLWALLLIMWTSVLTVGVTFIYGLKAVTPIDERKSFSYLIKIGILTWGGIITAFLAAKTLWLLFRWFENLGLRLWPPRNCFKESPQVEV